MEHRIVPESLGGSHYGGLMVAAFLLTWIFSLWLQFIIQRMRHISSQAQAQWDNIERESQEIYGKWNEKMKGLVGKGAWTEAGMGDAAEAERTERAGVNLAWGLRRRFGRGKNFKLENGIV